MFNIDKWTRNKKFIAQANGEGTKRKAKYAKASLFSIIFGSVVGIIIVFANGYNGFGYFWNMISTGFQTGSIAESNTPLINQTMIFFSAYALMGLGLALGFKVGLFNMGGSGQAVLGMGLSYVTLNSIAHQQGVPISELDKSYVVLIILMFILAGVLISTLAGILKTTMNIHEVVKTIMFNWIAWYLVKWMVGNKELAANSGNTPALGYDWLSAGSNEWIIGVVVALVSIVVVWLFLTFTTIGYKFKVIGAQPDAAKYSGIRNRTYIILTTSVQGLFIGLGAMFFYMQREGGRIIMQTDTIPTIGFDVIAVALVAFNNVLGIIPIALLWAVLKVGSTYGAFGDYVGISKETAMLVFGTIVYGAAIYSVFYRLEFFGWSKKQLYKLKDHTTQMYMRANNRKIEELKNLKANINEQESVVKEYMRFINYKEKSYIKNKTIINKLKSEWKVVKQNEKTLLNGKIKLIRNDNKLLWDKGYERYKTAGLVGIKTQYKSDHDIMTYQTLDEMIVLKLTRDEKIRLLKEHKKAINSKWKKYDEIQKTKIKELQVIADLQIDQINDEFNKYSTKIKSKANKKVDELNHKIETRNKVNTLIEQIELDITSVDTTVFDLTNDLTDFKQHIDEKLNLMPVDDKTNLQIKKILEKANSLINQKELERNEQIELINKKLAKDIENLKINLALEKQQETENLDQITKDAILETKTHTSDAGYELMSTLELAIQQYKNDYESAINKAKEIQNEITRYMLEDLNSANNKEERVVIKSKYYEKKMEVSKFYG